MKYNWGNYKEKCSTSLINNKVQIKKKKHVRIVVSKNTEDDEWTVKAVVKKEHLYAGV